MILAMLRRTSESAAAFLLMAETRWRAAAAAAAANTYTADMFASDAAALWTSGLDSWWSVLPVTGSPVIPTLFLNLGVGPASDSVYVIPVPGAPAPSITNLLQIGGTASITTTSGMVTLAGEELTVDLSSISTPSAGLYQGMVYLTPNQPLAIVVVKA
jgi:hypothetical protein